jgi:hypothetical protein
MKSLLLASAFCLVVSPMAFAQVQQSSQSNGQSTATSIIEEGGSGGGSGSGDGQGYYDRHGNNVDAVAPTMYSNDTCGSAAAIGASMFGVGLSAGMTSEIKGCVQRQWFILTMTAAAKTGDNRFEQWAVGIACSTPAIAANAPPGMCPSATQPVATVSYVRPAPTTYAPPVATQVATPARPMAAAIKPDWCSTWSKGDGALPAICAN